MVGKAVAIMLKKDNAKIVVGRDLNEESLLLERALTCGINSVGVDACIIGESSSSIVSFAIEKLCADAGIIITSDGGYICLKIFNGNGFAITKEQQSFIEFYLENDCDFLYKNKKIGKIIKKQNIIKKYIDNLLKNIKKSNFNKEIIIDCDNNLSQKILPLICEKLNIKYKLINSEKNKLNLSNFEFGVKFNNDLSHISFFDKDEVIDSEKIAVSFLDTYNKCCFSSSNNLALEKYVNEKNVAYNIFNHQDESLIVECMLKNGSEFGFDSSGRFMFLDNSHTFDGVVVFLKFVEVLQNKTSINEIKNYKLNYVQKIMIDKDKEYLKSKQFQEKLFNYESLLGYSGRIFINYIDEVAEIIIETLEESVGLEILRDIKNLLSVNT